MSAGDTRQVDVVVSTVVSQQQGHGIESIGQPGVELACSPRQLCATFQNSVSSPDPHA